MTALRRKKQDKSGDDGIRLRVAIELDNSARNVQSCKLPLTANNGLQSLSREVKDSYIFYGESDVDIVKPDSPLLIFPNGYILLFTSCSQLNLVSEFLIAVAEPISRPLFIHEYQLTIFSLYAAFSMSISKEVIVRKLQEYSRNKLSECLLSEINKLSVAFGKFKLVLRESQYYIESYYKDEIEQFMKHPVVSAARIEDSLQVREEECLLNADDIANVSSIDQSLQIGKLVVFDSLDAEQSVIRYLEAGVGAKEELLKPLIVEESKLPRQMRFVYSFRVKEQYIGQIKESALHELGRPLLSEYDFINDNNNPTLEIQLRQSTHIRYYQQRALSKMFRNGERAQSGIIVLPCGAGKTLTGIAASVVIKKSTLVLTSNSVAVQQWINCYLQFSTIDKSRVIALTADSKSLLPDGACVVCTTYTMISYSGRRSEAAARIMEQIKQRDWGLLIFDEVQFAPAPAFRRVTELCRSHCKLGLTATLVREDNLINDLHWLIGPKLDEANWQELQKNGYLAKAKCCEVWCPMTLEFYRAFLEYSQKKKNVVSVDRRSHVDIQRKLWTCNPNKLRACEYLIKFHEDRGDKIIVFSDYLLALKDVAITLKRPFVSGDVSYNERIMIIERFKNDPKEKTIFLSKVGDNAIDIPSANVVIQISFNYASRRQETQRLGRILRPKQNIASEGQYNAFFYSLASQDTPEITYADKRQQYIIDQGYAYQIITLDALPLDSIDLIFSRPEKQSELLQKILFTQSTDEELFEDCEEIMEDSSLL